MFHQIIALVLTPLLVLAGEKEKYKELVDKTAADTEARVRSELQLPPQRERTEETASPVLSRQFKPEIGPETPAAHQQRVLAAVAAHNEGRYHVEAPKPASVGSGGQ